MSICDRALAFGRTAQMKLRPLGYRDAALMTPWANAQEAFRYYGCLGGVPYCLSLVDPDLTFRVKTLPGLGIAEKAVPFGEDPETSKRGIYRLRDAAYGFWHHFVMPHATDVEAGAGARAASRGCSATSPGRSRRGRAGRRAWRQASRPP